MSLIFKRKAPQALNSYKKFISTREDYGLSDLLLSFTRSPFNVERRALRQERNDGRVFSIRAKEDAGKLIYGVHELGTTSAAPLYSAAKKKDYSKATGLGYCDPRFGFTPQSYRVEETDEIGFLFPVELSLLSKIFTYDGTKSSYYRFYEQGTRDEAEGLLTSLQEDKAIFSSLADLTQKGKNDEGYQVLARLTHGEGIKILLFSTSDEAYINAERAEALLIARIKQWSIENRLAPPDRIKIPIIYYLPSHPLFLQEYSERRHPFHANRILIKKTDRISPIKWLNCQDAHILAAHNDVESLQKLKENSPEDLEPIDAEYRTPLFYAAQNGHVAAIVFLLLAGANVKHQDNDYHYFIYWLFKFHYFSAFREVVRGLASKPRLQIMLQQFLFSEAVSGHSQEWEKYRPKLERYENNNPELIKWFDDSYRLYG